MRVYLLGIEKKVATPDHEWWSLSTGGRCAGCRGMFDKMGQAEKSYEEIVDLFARGGGAGAVLAFRPSAEAKARVQGLLEQSKQGGLSEDEQAELDRFGELEHLMQLVKVRARRFAT